MFSGRVKWVSPVLEVRLQAPILHLKIKKPPSFPSSIEEGDSLCVNGICLTLEGIEGQRLSFALSPETLKITGWTPEKLRDSTLNLEPSLTLQSAIGGHYVTGHGDGLALVKDVKKLGESRRIRIAVPKKFKSFFWDKAYIALNGVSLTVNKANGPLLDISLIPKTLKETNLSRIQKGDQLNFEVDYMSRPFVQGFNHFHKKNRLQKLAFLFLLLLVVFSLFSQK